MRYPETQQRLYIAKWKICNQRMNFTSQACQDSGLHIHFEDQQTFIGKDLKSQPLWLHGPHLQLHVWCSRMHHRGSVTHRRFVCNRLAQ